MNFDHIGIVNLTITDPNLKEQVSKEYVILFNQNFLTPEMAIELIQNNEYSDYVVVLPKSLYWGLFCDTPHPTIVS